MRFYKVATIILIGIHLCSCDKGPISSNPDIVKKMTQLSISEMDTFQIVNASLLDYQQMTNQAVSLYEDSIDGDKKIRGEILLSIISKNLGNDLSKKKFRVCDDEVQRLLNQYQQYQFFPYQPKANNFVKLMYHLCSGNYKYINSRFRISNFYLPTLILVVTFILFTVLNFLRMIPWTYRRAYNFFVGIVLLLISIIGVLFLLTCKLNISNSEFYGICF